MTKAVLMGLLSSLLGMVGCGGKQEPPALPDWANDPRKVKSEAQLTELGIPVNRWLPLIEAEDDVRIRDPKEVAKRAIVLHAIAAVGCGGDRDAIQQFLKVEGVWASVSPKEKILFEKDTPPEQSMIDASWRAEALWTLLWALGKVEELDLPTGQCDAEHVQEVMPNKGEVAAFINSAAFRPRSQIVDETDRILRIHWAVRDAQLNGGPTPARLSPSVVFERHYALNWLTYYADEWDDVTTDT